jgi:hypothetical protein
MMITNEIIFSNLTTADVVFMETRHSTYQFFVTDPAACAGILSGGLLNQNSIKAKLLCSVSNKEESSDDTSKIKVGSRAVFIYTGETGTRYLVISAITKLRCAQHPESEKNIFTDDSF